MKYTIYAESFAVNITKYETNSLDDILNGSISDINDLDRKKINSFTGIAANSRLGFFIESENGEDNYYFKMDEISGFEDGEITEFVSNESSVIITKINYSFADKNLIKIGEFEVDLFDLFKLRLNDFTLIDTMYFFTSMTYNEVDIFNPEYPNEDANSLYLNLISITNNNGNSVFNVPSIQELKDIFNTNITSNSITFTSDSFKEIPDFAPLIAGYNEFFKDKIVENIYLITDEEEYVVDKEAEEVILENVNSIIFKFAESIINYSKLMIHFSEISSSFGTLIDIEHSEKEDYKHALIIDSISCNDDEIENQFDIFQKSIEIVCDEESTDLPIEDEEENEDHDEEKEALSLNKLSIKPVIGSKQYQEVSDLSIFEQLTDKDSYAILT